jgi:hypothetical protein
VVNIVRYTQCVVYEPIKLYQESMWGNDDERNSSLNVAHTRRHK